MTDAAAHDAEGYPLDTAGGLIYAVDPLALAEFRQTGSVTPMVTFFSRATGARYGLNVLPLFQGSGPADVARRKASLVPTARGYLEERGLDALGYVFACLGFSADREDERTTKELAAGKAVRQLSSRVPVVLYCAERYEVDGSISRAYGEREVQAHPRKLLALEVRALDKSPHRVGFDILGNAKPGERT